MKKMWNNKTNKVILAWLLVVSMVVPTFITGITAKAEDASLKDYDAMTIEQILNSEESLTWVFAGDSITHNGSWSQGMNSYSEWFEQYLYDMNRGDDSVVLTAWGGADIYDFQYYDNTPSGNGAKTNAGMGLENMITKYNPDVVFIKLGMNDRGKATSEYEKYYNMMLDGIYAEGAKNNKIPKVVILTPTPLSGENLFDDSVYPEPSASILDNTLRFRNSLEKISSERGLLFCDLRTAFLEEQIKLGDDYRRTFFSDPSDGGIHPNAAGQYLIFKTLSKTLGIYDEEHELYQIEYADANSAALYVDETSGVTYTGGYDIPSVDTVDDATEMNATMPTLSGVTALSSVEFTSTTGDFVYNNADVNASTVDLTTEATGVDTLTVSELQTVGKEYSIVFRAKLNPPSGRSNQPIIFLSTKAGIAFGSKGQNLLMLGIPGTSNMYYAVRENAVKQATLDSTTANYGSLQTAMNDGLWHTVAVVQSTSGMTVYVDNVAYSVKTNGGSAIILNKAVSELFANANDDDLDAAVGRYDTTSKNWKTQGKFDYWQFYGQALTADQVKTLSTTSEEVSRTHTWKETVAETNVWAVAGAEQMSGYEGPVVNRSLFRLLDNVMRGGGNSVSSMRDVRLINLAKPGNTVAAMYEDYDVTIGEHNHDVLLVLPEVSQVYAEGYTHSDELVAEYKSAIKNLVAKEDGIIVLWTPLASNDAAINRYIDDYANAVREIAIEDKAVLFYDANKFMNENMKENEVLTRNWFEEDMYISPLCAVDLATSFYQTTALSGTGSGELTQHNLRLSKDVRTFKGEYVRDYIASDVTVNGTKVTVDVSAIKSAYSTMSSVWLSLLPTVGTGNFNENILDLTDVTDVAADGNTYTFEAPCSNPVIAVYGALDGKIYRFKDIEVDVTTSNTINKETPKPSGVFLNELEVVGAPAFAFDADTASYDVTLYQYQRNAQILAYAQPGLTISVNGETVESGEYSQLITVDSKATVTVKVSGVDGEKTYTLNLVRQEYPDIIITEVMQDGYGNYHQAGGDNYELIEIYNASGKDLNLKDYSIGFKKDYRYTNIATSGDAINYYFTGNNQAFQSTSSSSQTYTGINKITKYSSYWSDDTVTEPEEINFPADSTMVIWVKFSPSGASDKTAYGENLTYDTLIQALKENKDTYTLSVNGEAVVPTLDQLVVAEVPKGVTAGGLTATSNQLAQNARKNFYMDNHGAENSDSPVRSWLFILGADATQSTVGAITEEGNNIISASKHGRVNPSDKLSSVFSYNLDRGMSIVKDESYFDMDRIGIGNTSDQQGYSNLTSFGAIEYWQKPYDLADKTAPEVVYDALPTTVKKGENVTIDLSMSDETDLRYVAFYVMKEGDVEWTKVSSCDYVLESSVANKGYAKDVTGTKEFTVDLGTITGKTQYYGYVVDGNNNKVEFGSAKNPWEIDVTDEAVTGEIGTTMTVEIDGEDVEIVVGDVTGDGKVTIVDFVKLKAYLIGKTSLEGKYLRASDVNGDGKTSIVDFMRIKAYLIQ